MLSNLMRLYLDRRGWAVYYLHRLSIERDPKREGVSTTQINKILKNKVKDPSPTLLRKLSDILEIPWIDVLLAAGYIKKEDLVITNKEEIDPEIGAVIIQIQRLDSDKKKIIINTIKTLLKGLQ